MFCRYANVVKVPGDDADKYFDIGKEAHKTQTVDKEKRKYFK